MAHHSRAFDTELLQRFVQQAGLCQWMPDRGAGPGALSVSRPIEHDHAIALAGHIDDSAQLIILDHRSVAVQENERWPFAALDVVQPNTFDVEEAALRRIG